MLTWRELIDVIRGDPASDEPRLVCADWLIDRGDDRGDYVAMACQLARLAAEHPGVPALRAQLDALRDREPGWIAPVVELGPPGSVVAPALDRGFVDAVWLSGEAVGAFGAMCEREPITRLAVLRGGRAGYERLAATPALRGLRSFALDDATGEGCAAVFGSPYLAALPRLQIAAPWSTALIDAMVGGPVRPRAWNVPDLELRDLSVLIDGGFFDQMIDLGIAVHDAAWPILARAAMRALRRLTLHGGVLTPAAIDQFGDHFDRLEHLELHGVAVGAEAVDRLSARMASGRLRSLRWGGGVPRGGDHGARFLMSPALRSVEVLDVAGGPVWPPAFEHSPYRRSLRTVYVDRRHPPLTGVTVISP